MEVTVRRHRASGEPARANSPDAVIAELPLTIRINEASFTVMRTPGDDRDLVAGFLLTEGFIEALNDINALSECHDNPHLITVKTKRPIGSARRNMMITSSCGLCGHENIPELLSSLKPLSSPLKMPMDVLFRVPEQVRAAQVLFNRTGGAHAAALFDAKGKLRAVREDVGRHNALDKVIGHALLTAINTEELGVFLSGRASLELIIKAARARIPVVVSVSAPTAAAVKVAEKLNITLVGFARESGFTIYTDSGRISCPE